MEVTLKHVKLVKLGHAYYLHVPKAFVNAELVEPEKTYTVKLEVEPEIEKEEK